MSLVKILICVICVCVFVFFFKQKTAYEMRMSDWSSDVCSSDLVKIQYYQLCVANQIPNLLLAAVLAVAKVFLELVQLVPGLLLPVAFGQEVDRKSVV